METNSTCCKDLLEEVKRYNKVDIVVQALQTKLAKDTKDSNKNIEEILEDIKELSTGDFGGGGGYYDTIEMDENKPLLQKIDKVINFLQQSIGNIAGAITGSNRYESLPSQTSGRIEPYIGVNQNQLLNPNAEIEVPPMLPRIGESNYSELQARIEPKSSIFLKNQQSDISDATNIRDIPNIADTPDDKILIENKKQSDIFASLLETSEKSLKEQKAIKLALEDSKTNKIQPIQIKQEKVEPKESESSSIGDLIGMATLGTAGIGGVAKSAIGGLTGAAKGIGGVAKSAIRGLTGAARFAGPAAAIAGAAYGGFQGYNRAGEVFGVEQEQATFGQKLSSAVGGVTDPFGLGYGDSIAKGVYGASEKIGDFFGGIKDKVVGTANYIKDEYNRDLSYGGVGSVSSEQKISTASSLNDQSEQLGNKYDLSKSNYQSGTTAQKSLFGSSMLGSLFSKEGQTTGQFISDSSKQERLIGNAAELGLGSDVNVDYEKRSFSDLFGERISSGSIFKRDQYKVTDNQTGQELNLSKDEYNKIQSLVEEGKAEEAQKLFDEINAREAAYVPEIGIMPEEQMGGLPTPKAKQPKALAQPKGPIPEVVGKIDQLIAASPVPGFEAARKVADVSNFSLDNAGIREEMAASRGSIQPVVSNNIQTNNQTTYIPIKADPRPPHRGSALDRYNERIAAF